MFSPTYATNAAGLNYIRFTVGASDFSANLYSLDDSSGDISFSNFNINKVLSYSILSHGGWVKDSGSMNGGSLQSKYVPAYPTYLLKAVQGFQSQGMNKNPDIPRPFEEVLLLLPFEYLR
ncbi:uncharacterized protein LACBIDRAFT_313490 [Laccaria bicolor S238N-H82]|uniref:Predicted protein n=1 Tax=Laccaria bicolor (strain S238N-H82 / ATCC MYA-4686) TaxID=486041 RepID=B0D047_LACBS|nr:uncharacterized protein LACBIDRAFT_313490 [Laccaria bicolor S238N-H82]EDR11392.1 predicted protein [Laccaria bicolor S238N-H82]|eukprot:XP_001877289.1 predicted protein [Laccaria bicolor S238N-H82]